MALSKINQPGIGDASVTPAKLSTGAPTWDSSGNLGVGTSSLIAGAKFQVKTATDKNLFAGANSIGYLNDAGTSWVQTDVKGSVITFGTGQYAVESARIDSSVLSLTGLQGIKFQAAQSASSDANTLDDYEEGTWTPTVAFGGASVGLTLSSAVGRYTKVGRVVLIQCYLAIQNKGSSTGNMTIGGLPFPNNSPAASYASSPVWGNTLTSISGQLQGYLPTSSQSMNIGMSNTGTQSFLTQTNVGVGSDFMLDFSYIVD